MNIIECWACGLKITLAERSAEDGFCPKCHSEINLDEPPYDLNGGDIEDEWACS